MTDRRQRVEQLLLPLRIYHLYIDKRERQEFLCKCDEAVTALESFARDIEAAVVNKLADDMRVERPGVYQHDCSVPFCEECSCASATTAASDACIDWLRARAAACREEK